MRLGNFPSALHFANTYAVQPIVHPAVATYHAVRDVYHHVVRVVRVVHVVKTAYHAVAKVVKTAAHAARAVAHAAVSAAKTVGHAVATAAVAVGHAAASAASHVATFVKDYASTIAGIAAGVVVGAACTAATLGIGAVGCAAIGGAVGGAVSYGMDCSKAHNCSVGGAVEAVGLGALGGALGAGLAGPLGGKLVSEALDGVLPEVATQGLVGAGSGAVSGGVTALACYGLNCGRNCSVSGALAAAGSGALAGGAGGAAGGLRPRGRSSAETPGECHSFLAGTKVLLADGSSKLISSLKVGDRVANSKPGKAGLETHPVDRVIVTETDHDFVDLKVKSSRIRRAVGRMAASLAVAAAVVTGGSVPASAAPATLTTTYHHPFYDVTRSAFVEAIDLHAGDRLQTADGGEATVEELHAYYVYAGDTPVLVHNCGDALASYAASQREVPGTKFASEYTSPSGQRYYSTNRHGTNGDLKEMPNCRRPLLRPDITAAVLRSAALSRHTPQRVRMRFPVETCVQSTFEIHGLLGPRSRERPPIPAEDAGGCSTGSESDRNS